MRNTAIVKAPFRAPGNKKGREFLVVQKSPAMFPVTLFSFGVRR
jgi:hypothetical protein